MIQGVTYAQGIYVAVGDQGLILTSSDAKRWIDHSTCEYPPWWQSVTYGRGTFIAVGSPGQAAISTNGTEWIVQNTATDNFLYSVAADINSYIAVGELGTILQSQA
ncbi:hypothetical protein [Syntrophomonas palmitatica]|uniref:hypothetical protein n=1 Tax=Syntrophomonas palmitatica TaxID=402877 RepID=UPI0006CFFB3F|nr:hypothetical protein [Syntrophomonas palmitatica]